VFLVVPQLIKVQRQNPYPYSGWGFGTLSVKLSPVFPAKRVVASDSLNVRSSKPTFIRLAVKVPNFLHAFNPLVRGRWDKTVLFLTRSGFPVAISSPLRRTFYFPQGLEETGGKLTLFLSQNSPRSSTGPWGVHFRSSH